MLLCVVDLFCISVNALDDNEELDDDDAPEIAYVFYLSIIK